MGARSCCHKKVQHGGCLASWAQGTHTRCRGRGGHVQVRGSMIKGHGPLWGLCGDCLPYSGSHWAQPPRLSQGHLQRVAAQGLPRQGVLVPARPAASAHAAGRNGGKPRGRRVYHRLIGESAEAPQRDRWAPGQLSLRAGDYRCTGRKNTGFRDPPPQGASRQTPNPQGRSFSAGATPSLRPAHREPSDLNPLAGEQAVPKVTGSPVGEGPWDTCA